MKNHNSEFLEKLGTDGNGMPSCFRNPAWKSGPKMGSYPNKIF